MFPFDANILSSEICGIRSTESSILISPVAKYFGKESTWKNTGCCSDSTLSVMICEEISSVGIVFSAKTHLPFPVALEGIEYLGCPFF